MSRKHSHLRIHFPLLLIPLISFGFASRAECPLNTPAWLRKLNLGGTPAAEENSILEHWSNRYARIYPELGLDSMDLKSRKLTTRALVAIEIEDGGRHLTPPLESQLTNLLNHFRGDPALRNLSAGYITNLARGEASEAKRELAILEPYFRGLDPLEAKSKFGIRSQEDSFWNTLRPKKTALYERITVQDLDQKEHQLILLTGQPEGSRSSMERFHRALKNRYGSELYVNDDLVPSALGFYQATPPGTEAPFIILRSEHLHQDLLDFVGFHEGRHVMFKNLRLNRESVAPVEIQIHAQPGKDIDPWVPAHLNTPIVENREQVTQAVKNRNLYKKFMTYEENYTHAKDFQYACRMRQSAVEELFQSHATLPAHRLFDLELIDEKIRSLNEITYKTKSTSLDARLFLEKSLQQAPYSLLDGLEAESFHFEVPGSFKMNLHLSTRKDQALSAEVRSHYQNYIEAMKSEGPEAVTSSRKALLASLERFQSSISTRLIQSYDYALGLKINLSKVESLYDHALKNGSLTKTEYLEFRKALFSQGREARQKLFP